MNKSQNPRYQKEKKEKHTASFFQQQIEAWEALRRFFHGFKFKSLCLCIRVSTYSPKKKRQERRKIYMYIKDRTTAPIIHLGLRYSKSLWTVATANRLVGNQVVFGKQKGILRKNWITASPQGKRAAFTTSEEEIKQQEPLLCSR